MKLLIDKFIMKEGIHPFPTGYEIPLKPVTILVGDQGCGKSTLLELILKYDQREYKDKIGVMATPECISIMEDQNRTSKYHRLAQNLLPISFFDTRVSDPEHVRQVETIGYQKNFFADVGLEILERMSRYMISLKGAKPQWKEALEYVEPKLRDELQKLLGEVYEDLGRQINDSVKENYGESLSFMGVKMSIDDVIKNSFKSHGEALLPFFEGIKKKKKQIVMIDEPETALSIKSINRVTRYLADIIQDNQVIMATHHPKFMRLAPEVYDMENKKYVETDHYIQSQEAG